MNKVLCLGFVLFSAFDDASSMLKRSLVVPPTSPTRHQLIAGIGIPLELKKEAIVLGLVMKAQYFLVSCATSINIQLTRNS